MSEKTAVKQYPGMGAILTAKGVTLRVWAPHAEKVYVTGTFNDWSTTSTPLAKEENGYWSTDVSEAKTGDEYRYLIHGPKGVLSRLDPYARKVTSSIGNGVIYDPKAFDWGEDNFTMATGNELVIYEMHVGTFNVKEEGQAGTFASCHGKISLPQRTGYQCHRSDADRGVFRRLFVGV